MTQATGPNGTGAAPRRARVSRSALLVAGLLVLGSLGYLGWRLWWPKPPATLDHAGALAANLRGVGLMERFEYDKAVGAFEEAARLDPGWLPAQINLAISLLHSEHEGDNKKNIQRAQTIFGEVLAREPNHLHAHFCLGM